MLASAVSGRRTSGSRVVSTGIASGPEPETWGGRRLRGEGPVRARSPSRSPGLGGPCRRRRLKRWRGPTAAGRGRARARPAGADPAVEVGDDAPHGLRVLAAGVGDRPVDVPDAGHVGALLAAAERDRHRARGDGVAGQQLGRLPRGVQAERLERLGHLGVDVLAGLRARRQRPDAPAGVVLGQHPADDRAAAVADAGEDDLRDGRGWPRRSVGLLIGSGRRVRGRREEAAGPEAHVDQGDEDGHLDERADDAGQGLAGGDAEGGDRDGDGEFEVVARRGERQGGGALRSRGPSAAPSEVAAAPHDREVGQQRQRDADDVRAAGW